MNQYGRQASYQELKENRERQFDDAYLKINNEDFDALYDLVITKRLDAYVFLKKHCIVQGDVMYYGQKLSVDDEVFAFFKEIKAHSGLSWRDLAMLIRRVRLMEEAKLEKITEFCGEF